MKIILYVLHLVTALIITSFSITAKELPRLVISSSNRHIITETGDPFFWLGDTAWELFHRLNREEADLYLNNRADKGFNVIQAVVLAELDGLTVPNAYGNLPFFDLDPNQPNEEYFKHVDYIVETANNLGIYIAMLPTWGDKFTMQWGTGPEIFTPENAYNYGLFLAKRYSQHGIIWVLGGDRSPENENHIKIIEEMARGLKEGDQGNHLITYHPNGDRSSSNFFHNANWLNFNMFQSSHGQIDKRNYLMVSADYAKTPIKPVLDGEPCYEDHPVNWDVNKGWFSAFESRRAGYWAVLAGACGHTYGNHNIWQMWEYGTNPVSSARTPWYQAIDYPGAFQAGYMRRLFESRPWQLLVPEKEIISSNSELPSGAEITAAAATDSSFIMVYTPFGSDFTINCNIFANNNITAWWFNPVNGTTIIIGDNLVFSDIKSVNPPNNEKRGNDWVFIAEKNTAGFPDPRMFNQR